jgi:hypothetical protein
MPIIYPDAFRLIKTPKVGNGDCVALVRFYAGVPDHTQWKPGERVLDNPRIRPGTAIATFVNGRYPNNDTGQHTAFFLRHDAPGVGFWVVDQWKDKPGRATRPVMSHLLKSLRYKQNKDGTWYWASNNADAFSIIELR